MGVEFFSTLTGYIKNLTPKELVVFFSYPLAFGVSILTIKWISDYKKLPPQERAFLYAADAFLFALLGFVLKGEIDDPILKLLFRDMFLSLTALALAVSVFSTSNRLKKLRFLTYLGLVLALLVEVVVIFSTDLRLINLLIPLRKALIVISLYPALFVLLEHIPLKRLRRLLTVLITLLISAVGLAWEFGYIDFDTRAFIDLAAAVVISLLYSWFVTQGVVLLDRWLKNLSLGEEDREELQTALRQFSLLVLLWAYWEIGIKTLNLSTVVEKLKTFLLLDTDILQVSLYGLLVSVYLFLFLYTLIKILKKVAKLLFKPDEREEKGGSLEAVIYNIGILFALTVSLAKIGLTWKVVLPLAGALGIGLGFGLQTILNNYVSGFILMFSKNIKVGDFVELPGNAGRFINNPSSTIFGRVEDISVLTTRIKTLDGIDILVPNSTFIGSQIINYSFRNHYVRVRFPFGVAYSSDPKKVKEILLKVAYECPWAKNYYKPPQVWFAEMGDSALIFHLLFWVDIREVWRNAYATVSHGLFDWVNTNAWYKLKKAGIEIPFPQQDLWFRNSLKVVLEKEDGTPLAVFDKPNLPQREGENNTREENK